MAQTVAPKVVVVTMVTPEKEYCFQDTLKAIGALDYPKKSIQTLVIQADETIPKEYDASPYRCSLRAAWLREAARGRIIADYPNAEWVLWVDADVIVAPDTLKQLLSHQWPLVTGLVLSRDGGHPIVGWSRYLPSTGFQAGSDITVGSGTQPAGWAGMGCMLAKADLVRGIGFEPYLENANNHFMGEDSYFCFQAKDQFDAGLFLDASVTPWHVDRNGAGVRASWLGDTLQHELRMFRTPDNAEPALLARVAGHTEAFGEISHGQLIRHRRDGTRLTEDELLAYANSSEHLEYVPPAILE